MRAEVVAMLCDPLTHNSLHSVFEPSGEVLVNFDTGKRFPVANGIPDFHLTLDIGNQKAGRSPFKKGKEAHQRMESLQELEIFPGARVLEVGVGTGENWWHMPRSFLHFGLDPSRRLLDKCQKNIRHWKVEADLFQGEAEHLPFKNAVFDVVYYIEGANYLGDMSKTVAEMLRVAKPETKMLVLESAFYGNRLEAALRMNLIGQNVKDIQVKDLGDQDVVCLTFRKP